jgi:hypothetical protein
MIGSTTLSFPHPHTVTPPDPCLDIKAPLASCLILTFLGSCSAKALPSFPFTGGNSRTAMIAALSPADINYEETLSTLRWGFSSGRDGATQKVPGAQKLVAQDHVPEAE